MGLLVEGVWRDEWYDTAATGGKFERPATSYRDWIEAGGRFSPEAGRYHLYVSWACPWAHRTLIYRKLKGLDDAIGVIYSGRFDTTGSQGIGCRHELPPCRVVAAGCSADPRGLSNSRAAARGCFRALRGEDQCSTARNFLSVLRIVC